VELKALQKLSTIEEAQVLSYLKATGFERGLLINFGAQSLQYKRFILSADGGKQGANPQITQIDADY
jgi:hypothetical protein